MLGAILSARNTKVFFAVLQVNWFSYTLQNSTWKGFWPHPRIFRRLSMENGNWYPGLAGNQGNGKCGQLEKQQKLASSVTCERKISGHWEGEVPGHDKEAGATLNTEQGCEGEQARRSGNGWLHFLTQGGNLCCWPLTIKNMKSTERNLPYVFLEAKKRILLTQSYIFI